VLLDLGSVLASAKSMDLLLLDPKVELANLTKPLAPNC
jgi:hypothetical protein